MRVVERSRSPVQALGAARSTAQKEICRQAGVWLALRGGHRRKMWATARCSGGWGKMR